MNTAVITTRVQLGNTCQELGYDEQRIHALCAAYFGTASAAMLARMKLNMWSTSDVVATLGNHQAKISTIQYDFWGWATDRWERARG